MKIEEMVKDAKTWIALGAVLVAVAGTVTIYAQMPKKVEAIEVKVEKLAPVPEKVKAVEEKQESQGKQMIETQQQVQQVAASVDKFIAVQAEQRKADEEHKQMMLKIIEQVATQKKGR